MKHWVEKFRAMKAMPWVLLLLFCVGAYLLLPGSGQQGIGMTEEELRISATLSRISGAGETRVSIYYARETSSFGSESQFPVGAVIVSRGADDLSVRMNLLRAAETLLGLPADQVDVFPMEDTP